MVGLAGSVMKEWILLLCLVGVSVQQVPRLYTLDDIEASDLFNPPNDLTDPTSPWLGPLPPDLQKPQSHRTIYRCYSSPNAAEGLVQGSLAIVLAAPVTAAQTFQMRVDHPWLEIDPWQCANAAAAATGDCRCNNPASTNYVIPGMTSSVSVSSPDVFTRATGTWSTIPTSTYFEHAPFPGQSPYMKTYRKICMMSPTDTYFRDTTVWLAVVRCCSADSDCPFSLTTTAVSPPNPGMAFSWSFSSGVFQRLPDGLLDTNWKCNRAGYLGAFFDYTATPQPVNVPNSGAANGVVDSDSCWGESAEMTLSRQLRTTCCGANTALGTKGTCMNPRTEACCGWKPFSLKYQQCCSRYTTTGGIASGGVRINLIDSPCKCESSSVTNDCQLYGPNTAMSASDSRGVSERTGSFVATVRQCCTVTKYPELATVTYTSVVATAMGATTGPLVNNYGLCYNVTDPSTTCCDDGNIYDPGAQQCCPVNGVQSLNIPCPCNLDSQCPSPTGDGACCIQQWPRTWMDGQGPNALSYVSGTFRPYVNTEAQVETGIPDLTNVPNFIGVATAPPTLYSAWTARTQSQCETYANWPNGQAAVENQRCLGSCIDKRFQTCCNGAICVKEYDRCCNSTCCNRFTSGCMEGTRPGSVGYGSRINPTDYMVWYESCTSIEIFTTRRAFWVWVMPTFWTIATVISLAVVVVVARRATENVFPLTERAMVFFAILAMGLSVPHYFAPTYKYGIVIVFTGLFAIVGAVLQSKNMSIATVLIILVMLILWFDPFEGNIYLSLTGGFDPTRVTIPPTAPAGPGSIADLQTRTSANYFSGILEALFYYERNRTACATYYDYFTNDPLVHDTARYVNPHKTTFGFCTRAWMTTLLIFSIMTLAALLVLFTLSIFSLAKKLMPKSEKEDLAYELPLDAAPY